MSLDRVLLAIGPGDAGSADQLGGAVADIAGPADATVTLLHTFDPFEDIVENLEYHAGEDVDADTVAARHATIRNVRDHLDAAGVATTVRGTVGDPGPAVVTAATEIDADVLAVGGRGRSPAGKALFGSTANHVLRHAPCPVLYVRRPGRST
ncbi:MAG: universal stress protein [Halobacteriaceae archaeon]